MKHKQAVRLALAGFVAVLVLLAAFLLMPKRSVAAYCKGYKAEDARLANAKGDTYSVAVFSHRSSDPHDFVIAFANLERVAPIDIDPDVKSLKSVFDKIDKDPSLTLSASMSGISAESNLRTWTKDNCR